ncbi:hypothetical protein GB937_008545 [Aspergillus fischeri]|nr:hypothetical protein GB937_008545 [Aspergillus fischeri]
MERNTVPSYQHPPEEGGVWDGGCAWEDRKFATGMQVCSRTWELQREGFVFGEGNAKARR